MSGESLLETREEGRRRKEGICQDYSGVKGIHFRNGFFTDTSKLTARVFCAHFSDKTGNLSLVGGIYKIPYIESIKFTA